MTEDEIGFTILGVIFAMALLAAIVAGIKKRSAFGWFIGTLMFPPLLLLVLFLPSNRGDKASAAKAGKSNMPSWTQPAPIERRHDTSDDVQSALQRAENRTDSEVGKRILQMAARAAKRAEQRQRREQSKPRRERPKREQRGRPERVATVEPAEVRQVAAAAKVREVKDRSRQPRRGAVQRTGNRETVIYRRV